jgi:hypothetical protein
MTGEFEPLPRMQDSRFYHSGEITPEQAAALNQAYNFVIVGGLHFQYSGEHRPTREMYNVMNLLTLPLAAAKGDKLYIEGYGYSRKPDAYYMQAMSWLDPEVEALRRSGDIDTFHYAAAKVAMRGVKVSYADMHKEVHDAYLQQAGVVDLAGLKQKGSDQVRDYEENRSAQAAYTVKDDALAYLDGAREWPEKPTYMLVFGEGHVRKFDEQEKTIPEFYAEMGLEAQTVLMSEVMLALRFMGEGIAGMASEAIRRANEPEA